MRGSVAGQTLERTARIDQPLDTGILLIVLFQLGRNIKRTRERHVQLERNGFGNRIHLGIRIAQHTPDIADDRSGAHRSECDNLTDVIRTIAASDVVDDLLTAFIAEIDVDIRHGHALRIEESLEQQAVSQRIELGDIHAVGDD